MSSLNDLGFDPSRFKLGVLCKYGHDYSGTGKSLRSLSNSKCLLCRRNAFKAEVEQQKKAAKECIHSANNLAITLGFDVTTFYLGVLCKQAHDYQNTGYSLRYNSSKGCTECDRERHKRDFQDPEKRLRAKARIRQWYEENRERSLERSRGYYQANKDRRRETDRLWKKQNRERWEAYQRNYATANRAGIRLYQKLWSQGESGKASRRRIKSKRRVAELGNHSVEYTPQQLSEHIRSFGDTCAYCQQPKKLTLDHFIPISKGGSNSLGNLVPCCPNCNSSKHNADPFKWYSRQAFFSSQQWKKILKFLGKTEDNYQQIPLL